MSSVVLPRRVARAAAAALALASASAAARDGAPRSPERLSETGLYAAPATRTIAPGIVTWTPQYPLWSDGASKRRWLQLPAGTAVDASEPDAWRFPVGTKVWKEFSFSRRVETRYMERLEDGGWLYATYAWTADGSDAVLAPERGLRGAHQIRPGLRHDLPGVEDCKACHEGGLSPVLGFGALQLSPDRDPLAPHREPAPEGAVDLASLSAAGLLRGLPSHLASTPPRIAAATPRARAALGHLHGNCASCHNLRGSLAPLGLDLEQRVGPGAGEPGLPTAISRASRFLLPGQAAGEAVRIVPGAPERSVLYRRVASRSPLWQMPPLGTGAVDEEARALLEAWIREDLFPGAGRAHPAARGASVSLHRSTHPQHPPRGVKP